MLLSLVLKYVAVIEAGENGEAALPIVRRRA